MDSFPRHISSPRHIGECPRVAVLICVHQGADAEHFGEALSSLRNQTHCNLRIFLYCDGPTTPEQDELIARLLRLEGGQDQVFRVGVTSGLPVGLNRLIDTALGDPDVAFLARMDADDISLPERIAKQVAFMSLHPEVAAVGTWCIEFTHPGVPEFHKRLPTDPQAVRRMMLFRSALVHPTVLFRRNVLEAGFRYDPSLKTMQDYDLWSRLVIAGEHISNVPEYLLWFRMNGSFFSRRNGVRRTLREIRLRMAYARGTRQVQLSQLAGLVALFVVRNVPGPLKRLAYRLRR